MKKSRLRSREHSSSSGPKELTLFRNMSTEKPVLASRTSAKLHSLTPERQKDSPVRVLAMETIVEKKPKKARKPNPKKRKENYEVCLKEIKPINLEKEKEIFFSRQGKYSPFFVYANISQITEHDKEYKGMEKPHDKYMSLAVRILDKANKISYTDRLNTSPLMSMEETCRAFDNYIEYLQIDDMINYEFVENTVAPTSVIHNNSEGVSRVVVGLPIQYREVTVMGVLNHEIGTHFIRKYNNRLQKWHKERKKYNLQPYLKHEEGLAAVNQLFSIASSEQMYTSANVVSRRCCSRLRCTTTPATTPPRCPSPSSSKTWQGSRRTPRCAGASASESSGGSPTPQRPAACIRTRSTCAEPSRSSSTGSSSTSSTCTAAKSPPRTV